MDSLFENKRCSILIVDDNLKNLQVLGSILKNEGFDVEFALDGTTAIEWLRKKSFDLILLDIMMPGIDGYETCRIIKSDATFSDIPVIFLTAKTDSEGIVKGFETGAADYVKKPFIKSELLARVKTHLKMKKANDTLKEYLAKIEEQNHNITSSIEYAGKIQKAIMRKSLALRNIVTDYLIILLPKDIVSGDFYWFAEYESYMLAAVMDCTGHGVPGALMSILGISLLNDVVLNKKVVSPEKILESLREEIICSLSQKGILKDVRDGMDGVVLCYNPGEKILKFSAAYNSLCLIRNSELTEFKGDRMPVGYHPIMGKFSLKEIEILKDDIIYIFSDGYYDQFGGIECRKFMKYRFLELLLKIHKLPFSQQKDILIEEHKSWKGELPQTDDIIVAGLKF